MRLKDLIEELEAIAKTLRSTDPDVIIYHRKEPARILEVIAEDPDHSSSILISIQTLRDDYEEYVASKD